MRAVLLVCGARQLAYHPGARVYCRAAVGYMLDRMAATGHEATVLHGGALGPDEWSGEEGEAHRARVVTYLLNGWRLDTHTTPSQWSPVAVDPLERNRAMVAALVAAQAGGWMARVVGFLTPWRASTRGTAYTLDHAAERGLAVERVTVPALIR